MEKKIDSLYDLVESYDVTAAFICETWLKKNKNYERILEDVELNRGLKLYSYNRPGKRHGGGVSILADPRRIKLDENKFARRGFEIVSTRGKLTGNNKDIVLYCVYLPPNLNQKKVEEANDIINENIALMKLQLHDPIIVVAGDVNQFGVYNCVSEHPDISVVTPLCTRGEAKLDQVATNCIDSICENITVPAITSDISTSDHLGVFNSYEIKFFHQFKTKKYATRKYTKKGRNVSSKSSS